MVFRSITATATASVTWSDFNFDSDYSASAVGSQWKKLSFILPATTDVNGVRAFTLTSASNIAVSDNLPVFTTITNNTASFIITGSLATTSNNYTVTYQLQPTDKNRGDFEDGNSALNVNNSASITIPEVNVQMRSQGIIAKTRDRKSTRLNSSH